MVKCALGTVAIATLLAACAAQGSELKPKDLLRDMRGRSGANFSALLEKWENSHGSRAVAPLLTLARDKQLEDSDRYIALLAATRLGGTAATGQLYETLDDRSWMLRSAALRGLTLLKPEKSTPLQDKALVGALQDKALVVRREAVHAISELKPRGSVAALLKAAAAAHNYVQGRAQWIPQSALAALANFNSTEERIAILEALGPLAKRAKDPKVQLAAHELRRQLTAR